MTHEEILAHFERNDPTIIPYVKIVFRDMPELNDIDEIEQLAGELSMFSPGNLPDTRTQYRKICWDNNLSEDLDISVDEAKTAEALGSVFQSPLLDPQKESLMRRMNKLADELCRYDGVKLCKYAEARKDGAAAALSIDLSPFALIDGSALNSLRALILIAEDFTAVPLKSGTRLSFGVHNIWGENFNAASWDISDPEDEEY